MTLEEYKNKNNKKANTNFKKVLIKIYICAVLILCTLILCNLSVPSKEFIKKNLFEKTFNFSSINKLYNKYILNEKEEEYVNASISIEYKSSEKYFDGVKLAVNDNYPVKLLNSGIVVFIGEKEIYGNTIIVQQSNGVDVWYGNIKENIKLYDYIEKNEIIGEVSEELYLVFQKDGVFQDYNEFIK